MEFTSFMAIIPTWPVALLFVSTSVFLVIALTLYIRRKPWFASATENGEFIGLMYPMIGAIYGVVLAFTIVLSWQKFAEAEAHTELEVAHLSSLWRNSALLDCVAKKDIEERLIAYAYSVVNREWNTLAEIGKQAKETNQLYENIWRFYQEHELNSASNSLYREKLFYELAVKHLNEFGIHRRLRIMSATSEISYIVWIFLCVGGVVTVMMPMFVWTRSRAVQVGANGVMAFILAFSLWIVASLQYPYSGDVYVSREPFDTLIESFRARQQEESRCQVLAPPPVREVQ